ncbi:MAG: hypothetical protein R6V85_09400 [Polyangia bacterium]
MRRTLIIAMALLPLVPAGCDDDDEGGGGDDYLAQETVSGLPEGDASGDWASGSYELEMYTTACDGVCSVEESDWVYSICEVGNTETVTVEVEQEDGFLRIDIPNDSYFVQRLEGGIFADGSFDVGGYATDLGGDIQSTARAEGSISQDRQLEGTARSHVWGQAYGYSVDCEMTLEIEGSAD